MDTMVVIVKELLLLTPLLVLADSLLTRVRERYVPEPANRR
jgi:hypothetical protein